MSRLMSSCKESAVVVPVANRPARTPEVVIFRQPVALGKRKAGHNNKYKKIGNSSSIDNFMSQKTTIESDGPDIKELMKEIKTFNYKQKVDDGKSVEMKGGISDGHSVKLPYPQYMRYLKKKKEREKEKAELAKRFDVSLKPKNKRKHKK